MSNHQTLAESVTGLCVAGLAFMKIGAAIQPFLVPAAILLGFFADHRIKCDKLLMKNSIAAAMKALRESRDVTLADINTAVHWLKSRKQPLRLDPAALAEAAGKHDLVDVLYESFVDDSLARDGGARSAVRMALEAAYDICCKHDDYDKIFTQKVLIRLAKENEAVFETLDRIESKIDALSLSQSEREALLVKVAEAERDLGTTRSLILGFLEGILTRAVPPDQIAGELFRLAGSWHSAGQRIDALSQSHNLTPELNRLREQAKAAYDAEDAERTLELMTQIELAEEKALNALLDHDRDLADEIARRKEGLIESKTAKRDLYAAKGDAKATARMIVEIIKIDGTYPASIFFAILATSKIAHRDWKKTNHAFFMDLGNEIQTLASEYAANPEEQRELGLAQIENLMEVGRSYGNMGAAFQAFQESMTYWRGCNGKAYTAECRRIATLTGNTSLLMSEFLRSSAIAQEAEEIYKIALKNLKPSGLKDEWIIVQSNLARAQMLSGEFSGDVKSIKKSIDSYKIVDKILVNEKTIENAFIRMNFGIANFEYGIRVKNESFLKKAERIFKDCLEVYEENDVKRGVYQIYINMSVLFFRWKDINSDKNNLILVQKYLECAKEFRTSDRDSLASLHEHLSKEIEKSKSK